MKPTDPISILRGDSALEPFAKLANQYWKWRCCSIRMPSSLSTASTFFCQPGYRSWVAYHYNRLDQDLIPRFRLGLLSSEEIFFEKLSEVFYFLPAPQSHQLLKEAFNKQININSDSLNKLKLLIDSRNFDGGEEIHFISNSNPTHIEAFIALLKNKIPDINWEVNVYQNDYKLDAADTKNGPMRLAEGIYLWSSHQFKCFKVEQHSKKTKHGLGEQLEEKESLINIAYEHSNATTLVSNNKYDMSEGKRLGLNSLSWDKFVELENLADLDDSPAAKPHHA